MTNLMHIRWRTENVGGMATDTDWLVFLRNGTMLLADYDGQSFVSKETGRKLDVVAFSTGDFNRPPGFEDGIE